MLDWLSNSTFGICPWDLPALIVLIAIVVVFIVHEINYKRREKKFEDELAKQSADETIEPTAE